MTIDGMLKKEKAMQRTIDELNLKLRDVQNELEASQREYKKLHGEHLGLRKVHEEAMETIDALRRDLKHAQDECNELAETIRAKDMQIGELFKVKQRLEFEKEELNNVILDLEEKFKAEADKVAKLQIEIQNIRVTMEKALRAKEEEMEKIRRDLLRELETLQSSLEMEIKLKNDALKIKKKLEMEYKELEYTLETANKTIADYLREIKKLEGEIGSLQQALDGETAQKEELRNQLSIATKKLSQAYAELEELRAVLDATNRAKMSLEQELGETQDRINDLNMQLSSVANARRKLEADYASLSR
jgi:chromosome segregation ATPase